MYYIDELSEFCCKNQFVSLFDLFFDTAQDIKCFCRLFESDVIANNQKTIISHFTFENTKIPYLETFLTVFDNYAVLAVGYEHENDYIRKFMLSFVFFLVQSNPRCVSGIKWHNDLAKFSDLLCLTDKNHILSRAITRAAFFVRKMLKIC